MKISQVLVNESPLVLPTREEDPDDLGLIQIILSVLLQQKDELDGSFLNIYVADAGRRVNIDVNAPESFEPAYTLEDDAYAYVEAFYESMTG